VTKRPVEALGPKNLLAQQDHAKSGFEIRDGVALLLTDRIGTRHYNRCRRVVQDWQDLFDGIAPARCIF